MYYLKTVQSHTEIVGKANQLKAIQMQIAIHALSDIDDLCSCSFITITFKITMYAIKNITPVFVYHTMTREFTELPELTKLLLSLLFLINEIIVSHYLIISS